MVVGVLNFMSIYTVSIKSGLRKVTHYFASWGFGHNTLGKRRLAAEPLLAVTFCI